MSPSSSPSDLDPFAFLVGRGPVVAATSARAWLQAMLDVEAALAAAQGELGIVPAAEARAVAEACRAESFDVAALFQAAELGGNPVIPLVERLREAVGLGAGGAVHHGATSQDILDSGTMLVVKRAAALVCTALGDVSSAVGALDDRHGSAAVIGRTLLQHAEPTTFGTIARRWIAGLDAARAELERVAATLPVQLGGPVGDLSSFGPDAPDLVALVADRLGLVAPEAPWHTQRTPITAVAGAWGSAAAAVSSVAVDVLVLAQSDVGELSEVAQGAGGSSSMPHKRNPIAAISARAAAMQVPGLVATVLYAASGHELERAAGAWHAEWPALRSLLRAAGSGVDWLGVSVSRLVVDEERMTANLKAALAERQEP